MKEVFYRGKRIDNGAWVCGKNILITQENRAFLLQSGVEIHLVHIKDLDNPKALTTTCYEVDTSTVSEYIGVKDKNDKKIFEGDIVNYCCSDVTGVVKFGEYRDFDSPNKPALGFYVEYTDGGGELTQENMDFKESDEEYGCEVIGNIFDTPELIEY